MAFQTCMTSDKSEASERSAVPHTTHDGSKAFTADILWKMQTVRYWFLEKHEGEYAH